MTGSVFKRYEIKYFVTKEQRQILEKAFEEYMLPDKYGESTVCSVYYDTPDSRIIRRSLEKPVYKEKLRLRSYGKAESGQNIFMELKKKYKGVVYKRRILIGIDDAENYLADRMPLTDKSQIGREIEYFRNFYGSLIPAIYLCYDRTAYSGKKDTGLRITFDKNILWRTDSITLKEKPGGNKLIDDSLSLLEIKTPTAIPLWLTKILNENGIKRVSFSKYGTAYKIIKNNKKKEKDGVFCA